MKEPDRTTGATILDASGHRWSRRAVFFVTLSLIVVAAVPRFAGLNRLSFYGDEETSAFPARSLVQDGVPAMPSGMQYRRALPHTWMNALSARLGGVDQESSYRFPAAFLGTLTVLLIFLGGRRFLGDSVALVAALLMALSSWHLTFSRMNRMYAPLILFVVLATFAVWHWLESGRARALALAIVSFAAAVAFHALALVAVVFFLIPVVFPAWSRARTWKPVALAGVGAGAAFAYWQLFVTAPYRMWDRTSEGGEAAKRLAGPIDLEFLAAEPWWFWSLGVIGFSVGVWACLAAVPRESGSGSRIRLASLVGLSGLAGATAFTGHVYACALCVLLFLLLYHGERRRLLLAAWPVVLMGASGLAWTLITIVQLGVEQGARRLFGFPFPYPYFLWKQLWGVMLLFALACLLFAARSPRLGERGARASALGALAVMAALGVVTSWAPNRYLFVVYPFILIAGAYALVTALELASRLPRDRAAPTSPVPAILGAVVVACGLLGSHGVPQTWALLSQDHGRASGLFAHTLVLRPDHRAAGHYLRSVLEPGDRVIAEDPIQQYWYAGQADYWFRSNRDAGRFVHLAPDGTRRDNYVNSELLLDVGRLESIATVEPSRRVWFVNSAETLRDRDYYLNREQRAWLQALERTAVPDFVASDSLTRVFCLNCGEQRRGGS